ncbi:hypothetical protein MPH_10584 [Macrophomina phaseolina MS6]|uniref:Uncharacterized protein n=1 Tax=Macrophomina phaseolina (strain MS6) TaxID=1126212 RepID=K2RPZ3_MACPH|nr:hypothetical protein MPH_10584 [Macrophomina phaseolina MS6]
MQRHRKVIIFASGRRMCRTQQCLCPRFHRWDTRLWPKTSYSRESLSLELGTCIFSLRFAVPRPSHFSYPLSCCVCLFVPCAPRGELPQACLHQVSISSNSPPLRRKEKETALLPSQD